MTLSSTFPCHYGLKQTKVKIIIILKNAALTLHDPTTHISSGPEW